MKLQIWLNKLLGTGGTGASGGDGQGETLRRFLAKAVSGTFGFKILNVGLMYANSLLLVKLAGASGYGEYAYIIAWSQILLIPAALGFEGLISRELAVYSAQLKWAQAKRLLGFSNQLVLWNSLLLAVLAIGGFWLWGFAQSSQSLVAFAIGIATLPFLALSRLRTASLQAIKCVVASQLPEALVRPGVLFICLGSLFVFRRWELSAPAVMSINWIATAISFGVGSWLLTKNLSSNLKTVDLKAVDPDAADPDAADFETVSLNATDNDASVLIGLLDKAPSHRRRLWLKAAMPMLLIGSMYVINGQTDSIMLGSLRDTEAVGIYTVANRGAGLISFVQIAFATSLAPIFATLFANGELNALRRTIKRSCQATFALSLALAVLLVLFSHWFLLIFGPEFLVGKGPLFILIGGQLVNAFTGATAQLLIMTGNDRDTAVGVSISAVMNIILNALLIPPYGMLGAAIATALSTVLWNAILVGFTYKRFKVVSTAI